MEIIYTMIVNYKTLQTSYFVPSTELGLVEGKFAFSESFKTPILLCAHLNSVFKRTNNSLSLPVRYF